MTYVLETATAGLLVSPLGNPPPTKSAFAYQGQTGVATDREYYAVISLHVVTGYAGEDGSTWGDKVALYTATSLSGANAGNGWVKNWLLTVDPDVPQRVCWGVEGDVNMDATWDSGATDGPAGLVGPAIKAYEITGAGTGSAITAGFLVNTARTAPSSLPLANRGFAVAPSAVALADFVSYNSDSTYVFDARGSNIWGVHVTGASYNMLGGSTIAGVANSMTPGGALHVRAGVDEDLLVRGPVLASGGISLTSQNDAGTALEPLEMTASVVQVDSDLIPAGDGGFSLGRSSSRWSQLFASTGTINTSDVRMKRVKGALLTPDYDALLDAVLATPLVAYQWLDAIQAKGEDARVHYGVAAQQHIEELTKRGIEPATCAHVCADPWMETVSEAVEVTRQVTETIDQLVTRTQLVDGKAVVVSTTRPVERLKVEKHPVFDDAGKPMWTSPPKAASVVWVDPEGAAHAEAAPDRLRQETRAQPGVQLMHEEPVVETTTEARTVHRQKRDEHQQPMTRFGLRYEQFLVLRSAALERELRRLRLPAAAT